MSSPSSFPLITKHFLQGHQKSGGLQQRKSGGFFPPCSWQAFENLTGPGHKNSGLCARCRAPSYKPAKTWGQRRDAATETHFTLDFWVWFSSKAIFSLLHSKWIELRVLFTHHSHRVTGEQRPAPRRRPGAMVSVAKTSPADRKRSREKDPSAFTPRPVLARHYGFGWFHCSDLVLMPCSALLSHPSLHTATLVQKKGSSDKRGILHL